MEERKRKAQYIKLLTKDYKKELQRTSRRVKVNSLEESTC